MLVIISDIFGARYATYEVGITQIQSLRSTTFSPSPINTSSTPLVPLVVPRFSAIETFLSISQLVLQLYDFFLVLVVILQGAQISYQGS